MIGLGIVGGHRGRLYLEAPRVFESRLRLHAVYLADHEPGGAEGAWLSAREYGRGFFEREAIPPPFAGCGRHAAEYMLVADFLDAVDGGESPIDV